MYLVYYWSSLGAPPPPPFPSVLSDAVAAPLPIALGGAVLSLVVKEALFHATLRVGKAQYKTARYILVCFTADC
jgi:hypothetical protein